ncbi:sulfatase family protein [Paenibacillus arenilitoris]|uniref:Sulfatase-like hydrolase/transferase n=1 Tax=Paenibacillus arenilitoris TaxID=2772299 RepID=A0A927CMJ7_9BACL|nr:sulfatase-like hydrolase/transferase [Paenibacillus arenilitoris]MBD2870309.1 sulfatase-like hydrolase/transferase [Paenibacillus arenilitoris]
MSNNRPNIVLIQTDQQSAETLGLYGNAIVRTPHLQALAERGVVFEHAYCNYPACSPSRSSMMTGRYASTIRCHANHMLINPTETTLPQVLKESGYQTALIGKNHAFMDGTRVNEYAASGEEGKKADTLRSVFDYVREGTHGHLVDGYRDDPEVKAAHQWAVDHCWKSPLGHGTNPAPYEKCSTYLLGETALEYLEHARDRERPFFLWLSFPDPHTPYQAPEPYASLYKPEDVPLPPKDDLSTKPERQRVAHMMDAMDRADDQTLRKVRAIHYGMINFVDDAIGRVTAKLDELGLTEDTLILFTSDHGDSMGAHGLIQKHNMFYDSFTQVPLIVSWPGKAAAGRCGHLIELVDLMPTILEAAGCRVPGGVQGKSFASYMRGEDYAPREYAVIESGEAGEPIGLSEISARPEHPYDESCFVWCAWREAWLGKGKSIRTLEWKLNLYENGEGELYDLAGDPDELVNLYGDARYQDVIASLERKLLQWFMRKEDASPANSTVNLNYREKYKTS